MADSLITQLRKEIKNIRRAQACGTSSFSCLAVIHCSRIYRAAYRDIKPVSDTMAIIDGRYVITHENLQYFPAKVHYFYPKYS